MTPAPAAKVAVVDSKLLYTGPFAGPLPEYWRSSEVVPFCALAGLDAEVVGLDTLRGSDTLASYRALILATEHQYPDTCCYGGPVAQNIRDFVRRGGIYIAPTGFLHVCAYLHDYGKLSEFHMGTDFFGLTQVLGGGHAVKQFALTEAGVAIRLPDVDLLREATVTYANAIANPTISFLEADGKPILCAFRIGRGYVIHWAGGLRVGEQGRDWLLNAYATIIRTDLHPARFQLPVETKVLTSEWLWHRGESQELSLDGKWQMACADSAKASNTIPDGWKQWSWTDARVPSTVQTALFETAALPDPYSGTNSKEIGWIEQKDWWFRREFTVPAEWRSRTVHLAFDGIDYYAYVWLNGIYLGHHEGMFGGPTFDVTDDLEFGKPNQLIVKVVPTQKSDFFPATVVKAQILARWLYALDSIMSVGIWRAVRLVSTDGGRLANPFVKTVGLGKKGARLNVGVDVYNYGGEGAFVLHAHVQGENFTCAPLTAAKKFELQSGRNHINMRVDVRDPALWWPNGMGDQNLYRLNLALKVGDRVADELSTTFAIRTIETRANYDDIGEYKGLCPGESSDSWYDWNYVINGVPIFCKGVNWVPMDLLLRLPERKYRWFLELARNAHVNIIRIWGGGLLETDEFYRVADELGIMIQQDFPLNCAYDLSQMSQDVWASQVAKNIKRLRNHPSLVAWAGGNEFHPYLPQNLAIVSILESLLKNLDGTRPFYRGDPDGGSEHAYTVYSEDETWYPQVYNKTPYVTEYSFPTLISRKSLEKFLPPDEMELLDKSPTSLRDAKALVHHWCQPEFIEVLLKKASEYCSVSKLSLPELVDVSQIAQATIYKYATESWRSNYPTTCGAFPWVYNDPWPTMSWEIVDWYGTPNASYYFLQQAYEPVHVHAVFPYKLWPPKEKFVAEVRIINDLPTRLKDYELEVQILDSKFEVRCERTKSINVPAGVTAVSALRLNWRIAPDMADTVFFLAVTLRDSDGTVASRSVYFPKCLRLLADDSFRDKYRSVPNPPPDCPSGPWLYETVGATKTRLRAEMTQAPVLDARERTATLRIAATNDGAMPAFPVKIEVLGKGVEACASYNYFWLAPGERREVGVTVLLDTSDLNPGRSEASRGVDEPLNILISAWNCPAVTLDIRSDGFSRP